MRSVLTKASLTLVIAALGVTTTAQERRHVRLKSREASDVRPFDDAVRVGNTLYLAGRIGTDATGKVPAEAAAEARTVMDQIKSVLAQEGMTMDDVVTVTVYCTDLSLYSTFNDVYRTYFTKGFPARAFIGSGSLLAGGRFEVQAIAVKQ